MARNCLTCFYKNTPVDEGPCAFCIYAYGDAEKWCPKPLKQEKPTFLDADLVLRPEVSAFAQRMESILRKNDDKGGWSGMLLPQLLERLHDEVIELDNILDEYTLDYLPSEHVLNSIINEAVDVSNFAMMIADTCSKKLQVK
jgi:hypothetical protein